MTYAIVIGSVVAWLALGWGGFIYWWTSEFDLTSDEIFGCLLTGILGPFSWVIGAVIHGHDSTVIIRRRS